MKRHLFGSELRQQSQHTRMPPEVGPDTSGSQHYHHYNTLRQESADKARVFGKKALLHTVWSPNYQLLDYDLQDQSEIDTFSNEQIHHLLERKHETILGQKEQLEQMLPTIYETYTEQVERFIAQGHIPAVVGERLPSILEQTEWVLSDGLNNNLGLASPITPQALINSDVFTPHHSYLPTEDCVRQIVTHELTHRLAGVWVVKHNHMQHLHRMGMMSPRASWLNEAVTELIADSITHRQWNPPQPQNPNSTYLDERQDLRKLLALIPPDALVSYYFAENDGGTSKRELHRVFRQELGMSFDKFIQLTANPALRSQHLTQLQPQHTPAA